MRLLDAARQQHVAICVPAPKRGSQGARTPSATLVAWSVQSSWVDVPTVMTTTATSKSVSPSNVNGLRPRGVMRACCRPLDARLMMPVVPDLIAAERSVLGMSTDHATLSDGPRVDPIVERLSGTRC